MTKKTKYGKIALIIIVSGIVGWGIYSQMTQKIPVQTVAAEKGVIKQYIDERARTTLPHVYHITMPEDGRIEPIELIDGDVVTQNQILVTLEKADLTDAMRESKGLVAAMKSAVKASQEQIKASKANMDFSEWLWKAKQKLYKENAVSETQEKNSQKTFIESQVNFEKDTAQSYAMQALFAVSKLMPIYIGRSLRRTDVKSPINGIVLKRYVWNKKVMQGGDKLMDVGNLDALRITADVLTEEAVTISKGDSVKIYGETIGDKSVRGTVTQVKPQAFTKLSSLGVEQQRVPVIIEFNPDDITALKKNNHSLGLEYRVRVRIFTDENKNAIIVPRTVLFRGNNRKWQAYVVRKGKTVLTDLEIGIVNDNDVEILKGINEGDIVVIAPESTLKSGVRVVSTK